MDKCYLFFETLGSKLKIDIILKLRESSFNVNENLGFITPHLFMFPNKFILINPDLPSFITLKLPM